MAIFECRKQNGLTLVEVIVGLALIGIVATTFISVYTYSMYLAVRSSDRIENLSTASSIIENSLGGVVVRSSLTDLNTIEIVKPGGEVAKFQNSELYVEQTALEVRYNGSLSKKRNYTSVEKVTITSIKDTANGVQLETEIEVYKP